MYLRRLPGGKASGPDSILYKLLKALPRKVIVQLMHIITTVFCLQHLPSSVIISLLNTLAKLVEKLILSRISEVADRLSVIPEEKFALLLLDMECFK